MPNPELSQYRDKDTDIIYDLKDPTARSSLTALQNTVKKDIIAIYIPSTGYSSGHTTWGFSSGSENYGYFDGHDMQMVRIVFNSNLADFTKPVQFIYYGDYEHGIGAYVCDVYSDWLMTDSIDGIYKNGQVLDFIFSRYANSFVLVGCAGSVDLSNYYTKSETNSLLNDKADTSSLATVATSGDYDDLLNKPTIPSAQVNSDWNAVSGVAQILNKPSLATVATSGSYNDLTDQPTIPDISTKMDKSNPTGTGKLSINRLYNSTEGTDSVAVGNNTTASGIYSHAEGNVTVASGSSSHAEGTETTASGNNGSHAEGQQTEAAGRSSHAEGNNTIAASDYQHVSGKFNVADNADTYAEIIGNGPDDNNRSNARTLDWSGNETIAGDLYFNGNVTALSSQLSAKADSSSLAPVATSGLYSDLSGTPTIPAAQVNSDWNANSGVAEILNKPSLATVATSGDYDDLINKLTAGTNISISATNEISATDTKPGSYSGDITASASPVSNSTSWTELLSETITAGTWLVNWGASFPSAGSSNTGYRGAGIATTGDPYAYMMQQVPAVSNNTYTCLSGMAIYTATGNTTLRLKVRQYQGSSGTSLNVSPRLQVIRIL